MIGWLLGRWVPDALPHRRTAPEDAGPTPLIPDDALHTAPATRRHSLVVLAVGLVLWVAPVLGFVVLLGRDTVFVDQAVFFSGAALVTFGGAYAVLAFVAQQAVDVYGWLAPGEMVRGLALAESTPGPLIMVVQFVAFLGAYRDPGSLDPWVAGVLASLLTVWVTFVPCFVFIFLGAPYVERLRGHEGLSAALTGITAAVVGVIANLAVLFALATTATAVVPAHLPGAGGSIANILAYDQAKKVSKHPEKFGTGIAEGIIAPESSNNAVEGGALITMMALGIPGDVTTAVMLGALLIHDVIPSPTFIAEEPVLAYSIFLAFFVATFLMLGLQSFMLRAFVLVTKVRMYILASVILGFCGIGVFAINNVEFDLWTLLWFGILGLVMRHFGFPLAPMILGVVLGNIAELNLARSFAITTDLSPFVTRPWSLLFLVLALFSAIFPLYQSSQFRRRWTLAYSPCMTAAISIPVFMMGGAVRSSMGVILLAISGYLVWRRVRSGWQLPTNELVGVAHRENTA